MNFLIIYSGGKWVADVFLGNFPCWSLFNLRARFLLFGNEKSQKLNSNNLKSKRPLAVRENEAVWQKTRKTVCVCVCWCVCICLWLCVMRVLVKVDVNNIDFVCYCMFGCMQFYMCVIQYKHHFSVTRSVHKHSMTLWDMLYDFYARAMHTDARVCFVLDPLSSSFNLILAKRQLPLQFSRSLILMAGPLWDWVGACGDRWMRPHTHIKHTQTHTAHVHTL